MLVDILKSIVPFLITRTFMSRDMLKYSYCIPSPQKPTTKQLCERYLTIRDCYIFFFEFNEFTSKKIK